MGGGKGAGAGGNSYDYFGTIAGAVCAGPVDELLAIIIDGKTVWPSAAAWATGKSYAVGNLVSVQGVVYKCTTAHTSSSGNTPPNATYWTRYSVLRSASANPLPVTVEGFGAAYFYWGTSTQTLDATGEKTLSDKGHPPYRRQAFIVLKDFLFGRERTSAPNLEVIVRRAPNQSVVTGSPAALNDGQANAIAALADLYTDPVFGAGLVADTPGAPDSATWQSAATALDATPAQTAISPKITGAVTLRQFTAELLAYVDGFLRFNSAGEIEAGRFPHNAAPPTFTAANTIDYHDLIDEVQYTADGWEQTVNQTQVQFTDRERGFQDGGVVAVSGYNLAVTGEPRTKRIDRPWITRRQQATDHAAEFNKIIAEPKLAGSLVVRQEKADTIRPGDLFLLTHDALSVSVVCRCIGKDIAAPPAGRATIRFESDRASAPVPYQPSTGADPGTAWPDLETLSLQQLIQPPPALVGSNTDATIVPLVARTSSVTIQADLWLRSADTALFYRLDSVLQFAVYGTMQAAYNPSTLTYTTASRARTSNVATITTSAAHGLVAGMTVTISGVGGTGYNGTVAITSTPNNTTFTYASTGANETTTTDTGGTVDPGDDDVTEAFRVTTHASTNAADLAKVLQTQTEDAVSDNALVAIVFNASNRKQFEVFAVRAIRMASGETFYRIKVRRSRYNTTRRAAASGDPVFLVYRNDLVAMRAQGITDALTAQSTAVFRLQSATAYSSADVADTTLCPDISYTFNDPYAPVVTWNSVTNNGAEITDFTAVIPLAHTVGVMATITDASGDFTDAWIIGKCNGRDSFLWTGRYAPSKKVVVDTSFVFPYSGVWTLYMGVLDASGRVKYYQLTDGGGTTKQTLLVDIVASDPSPPTASPYNPFGFTSTGGTVTLSCSTAGASIKYAIVDLGVKYGGVTWVTYTGPFTLNWYFGKTVWAYSELSPHTSPVVRFDFWYQGDSGSGSVPPGPVA